MKIIKAIVVLLCVQGSLLGASAEVLTAENLRAMPKVFLQSEDIVNLLSGGSVGIKGRSWSLVGTSFPTEGVGRICRTAEIFESKELNFNWLFYVKENEGKQVLGLHKMFRPEGVCTSFDERLLISTPVTDDFADNPWVRATTVCGEASAESFANIKQLFKPHIKKE